MAFPSINGLHTVWTPWRPEFSNCDWKTGNFSCGADSNNLEETQSAGTHCKTFNNMTDDCSNLSKSQDPTSSGFGFINEEQSMNRFLLASTCVASSEASFPSCYRANTSILKHPVLFLHVRQSNSFLKFS